MADVQTGYTFGATEEVTNAKLNSIGNSASVSNIVNADIDANAAIADTKLAQLTSTNKVANSALMAITTAGKVDGAAITGLANTPSGAGVLPAANIPLKDEDDMASDSAVHVPSQQSTKAYVLAQKGAVGAKVAKAVDDTMYQAATDGWICCHSQGNPTATNRITSDASNPPTTVVALANSTASNQYTQVSWLAAKNEYYKITANGAGAVGYFRPTSS